MIRSIVKYINKNLIAISVVVMCIYALYLRIMFLCHHSLWLDELVQLDTMKGTFLECLKLVSIHEFFSYLCGDYCLIYPFFKIFGFNKWGLALPHILSTIIGFYILYFICKRYFKTIWAYLITFGMVCFNSTLIQHATEIRPYAVLPTLALATFYLFQRISDLNMQQGALKKIATIMFFILVIWFHFYGVLIFTTCFLFTLSSKYGEGDYKRFFKKTVLYATIILCLAMPFWLYSVFFHGFFLGRFNVSSLTVIPNAYNVFAYIPNPLQNIVGFLKGILCNLIGHKLFYLLLIGMVIPLVSHYQERNKQLLFLALNVIAPIIVILLIDLVGGYWFLQRQFIWVMPFFAFFLGWVWDSFFIRLKHKR